MKSLTQIRKVFLIFTVTLLSFYACKSEKQPEQENVETQSIDPALLVGNETKLLLEYLDELGDYVNSRSFPSLIKASSVFEGLGEKQLVIDIRTPELYDAGHIKGAVNIDFSTLPVYFESEIIPFEFEKIILISEAGQESSYATGLLRLMGYGNVYSLRWGMSSWNKDFAKSGWQMAIGSDYIDMLEANVHSKGVANIMPELNTGKQNGEEILLSQIEKLFAEGVETAHLKASDVFNSPEGFYVMNYIRRDKYEAGHIPGAIRYKPQATLGIVSEMVTIPSDKSSVVYCGTGHNSGFVTAYLRLFGYDAKTLIYGNNSFMYSKMVEQRETLSWLPFTEEEIRDYPYEK